MSGPTEKTEGTEGGGSTNGANGKTTVDLALVGGLTPGANLRENRLFHLTPTGAEFAGEPSFEQWEQGMAMLRMSRHALQLWLADFMSQGRKLFGDERVQATVVQLEFPQLEVDQALAIGAMPAGVRRAELTSEHYWVLARAGLDAAGQERWAAAAVECSLTAGWLAKSIAAGKVLAPSSGTGGGRSSGVATIQGIAQLFDSWQRRVEEVDPIAEWETWRLQDLWEELKGPVTVGLQVARKLGIQL